MIQLKRTAADYVGAVTPVATSGFEVEDGEVFAGEYADNHVLCGIIAAVSTVRPVSLLQVLHLGGYELCEAVLNAFMHGDGSVRIGLSVGLAGLAYEVAAAGPELTDDGRTTAIMALAADEGAFYDYYLDRPMPALDGHSPREAAGDPALSQALGDWLSDVEREQSGSPGAGSPEWGYSDLAHALRVRLRPPLAGNAEPRTPSPELFRPE